MSDGSSTLTYLDPQTYQAVKKLNVTINGRPALELNELEFIEGEIWSNVWQSDMILRIDPQTGKVTSYLDMRGVLPREFRTGHEDEGYLPAVSVRRVVLAMENHLAALDED